MSTRQAGSPSPSCRSSVRRGSLSRSSATFVAVIFSFLVCLFVLFYFLVRVYPLFSAADATAGVVNEKGLGAG